jgi:hypothetical protein
MLKRCSRSSLLGFRCKTGDELLVSRLLIYIYVCLIDVNDRHTAAVKVLGGQRDLPVLGPTGAQTAGIIAASRSDGRGSMGLLLHLDMTKVVVPRAGRERRRYDLHRWAWQGLRPDRGPRFVTALAATASAGYP